MYHIQPYFAFSLVFYHLLLRKKYIRFSSRVFHVIHPLLAFPKTSKPAVLGDLHYMSSFNMPFSILAILLVSGIQSLLHGRH